LVQSVFRRNSPQRDQFCRTARLLKRLHEASPFFRGLVSGAVRFLASLFLGGLAVSAVESAYRRAATNHDDEAP
jgi:hypothetical protein